MHSHLVCLEIKFWPEALHITILCARAAKALVRVPIPVGYLHIYVITTKISRTGAFMIIRCDCHVVFF